jgi:hypothetical protein
VARLTLVLEGPGSPIEEMLSESDPKNVAARAGAGEARSGDLADRIRALQSRASRAAAASP